MIIKDIEGKLRCEIYMQLLILEDFERLCSKRHEKQIAIKVAGQ